MALSEREAKFLPHISSAMEHRHPSRCIYSQEDNTVSSGLKKFSMVCTYIVLVTCVDCDVIHSPKQQTGCIIFRNNRSLNRWNYRGMRSNIHTSHWRPRRNVVSSLCHVQSQKSTTDSHTYIHIYSMEKRKIAASIK